MGGRVFEKDDAGIRKMLQASECLQVMEQYANNLAGGAEVKPFIGYDRAKCFIIPERKEKKWSKQK